MSQSDSESESATTGVADVKDAPADASGVPVVGGGTVPSPYSACKR